MHIWTAKWGLATALVMLVGCQATPRVQPPILLHDKPMIVVRHNGGSGDGACPMWVKVDGAQKGIIERNNSLAIDVENGVHLVSLGRSSTGVYGAATVCVGSDTTSALVGREVEVDGKPVRLVYEMHGTGKRWIPIVGFFLAPTPALALDSSSD